MSGRDQRIEERAYTLWEQEGRPEGQASEHWERARRLIEEEDSMQQQAASSAAGEAPKPDAGSGARPARAEKTGTRTRKSKVKAG